MSTNLLNQLSDAADASVLRTTFACFPSGVAAVCVNTEMGPIGLLVSSFTSVSLDPPLASICLMKGSRRWSLLAERPRLGVSFLGETHRQVCSQFARPLESGFRGIDFESTPEGAVFLCDATAWLDCSVETEIDAGDHTIALLRIEALQANPSKTPLVFHNSRYHGLSALSESAQA